MGRGCARSDGRSMADRLNDSADRLNDSADRPGGTDRSRSTDCSGSADGAPTIGRALWASFAPGTEIGGAVEGGSAASVVELGAAGRVTVDGVDIAATFEVLEPPAARLLVGTDE